MRVNGTALTMIRGDSEALTVKVTDVQGAPVPLASGDIVYFTVKTDTYTEATLIQKVITEFDGGIAHIDIRPEDTKVLSYGGYVYDVQVTFADGTVKTVIPSSPFTVAGEVTYE